MSENPTKYQRCLRFPRFIAFVAVAAVALACSGQSTKDPDGDETRLKARAFLKSGPTEDKLDTGIGDFEDWRFFLPDRAGKQEIRISIGKWEESTIVGFVTIFTEVGDLILERTIQAGSGITIKELFDVEPNMRYLVRFKATAGKGKYAVEVGDPEDPCAACTEKQLCQDGRCVDKPCGGECSDNEECDEKTSKCRKKGGHRPDPAVNRCEGVQCDKGEVCQRSTGRCIKLGDGPSGGGNDGPDKEPDIDATVIDAREAGTGSLLTLSAGDNKGVKKGMTGAIKGLKGSNFTITEVYPSRSKAACKLPPAKLVGNTAATIKR
jgi:hypothetical protein